MLNIFKKNDVSKEAKSTLKLRTLFGLAMLAVVVPCLVFGGWAYLSLIILLIGASTYEIAKAPSRKFSWFIWAVTFIVMYSLIFWIMLKTSIQKDWVNFDINTSFTEIWLSPIALAMMIFLYLLTVILKSREFKLLDACYLIAMTLLIALGFQAILAIRYIPFQHFADQAANGHYPDTNAFKYGQSMFLALYLLIAITFNDIGAYLVGVFFGKHKMAPHVSPKKTWEGFAGGVFFSVAFSVTFGLVVAAYGLPMLPKFTLENWYWTVIVSVILPLVGVLGDLAFSAIKRQFGKKDYSKVLGPHGGILDRIDSVLFGALALAILVIFITNGWDFLQ